MLYLDDEKTELISNLRNQIAVLTTPPPAPQDESDWKPPSTSEACILICPYCRGRVWGKAMLDDHITYHNTITRGKTHAPKPKKRKRHALKEIRYKYFGIVLNDAQSPLG